MKTRLLSLFLALALTMGLTIPAFAADSDKEAHLKTISLTYSIDGRTFGLNGEGTDTESKWTLTYPDFEAWNSSDDTAPNITEDYDGYYAVRQNTVFTVKNTSPAGQNSTIRVYLCVYTKGEGGVYEWNDFPHSRYLVNSGDFIPDYMRPDDLGGLVELKPGESCQFKLPEFSEGSIYKVEAEKFDLEHTQTVTDEWGNSYEEAPYYNKWAMFKVDNAAVDRFLSGGTPDNPSIPPEQPTTSPEQPTTPPTNADSYPYSIPGTPDFLRFSVSPIGSYRTTVPEFDANDNLYDKEVTVYEFEVGTKLGLTGEGIQKGYSIANLSSDDFEDMDRPEFTITKGSLTEQWYFVNSENDPEGFIAYIHPVNTNTVFQDVAAGEYYEDAVKWAVKYGITNGTSNTSFTPGRTCSNAEILTMVYRAFEWMPVSESNPFADVKQSDYYYQAARWAAEYNIVSGATFDPDKPCTRAMAMTYIWKALMSPDAGGSTNFTDVPGGADYAKAVAWAVDAGVTNGTSATTFSPNDTCTRGQIVTFLHRAMG